MSDHAIFNRPLDQPLPQGYDLALFGMGCFWAPEQLFWRQTGVWLTATGFAGGNLEQPQYDQVKAGGTGHAEVVRIAYDSSLISYERLLKLFWEHHNPTLRNGAQAPDGPFRSLIMAFNASQRAAAKASRIAYGNRLALAGFGAIATQIIDPAPFWPAPDAQQQYLAKNPGTDCEAKGTGVEASIPNPDFP